MNKHHSGHWIEAAIQHPGAFTKKAHAAGKSVGAFAKVKQHASGTLGKQARLAIGFFYPAAGDVRPDDLPKS